MSRKVYGQSQTSLCPFCGSVAMAKNSQNVPTCTKHAQVLIPEVKCVCGRWLVRRESKFGVFFTCDSCGPVSFTKMMQINGEMLYKLPNAPKVYERERMPVRTNGPSDLSKALRVQAKVQKGQTLTPDELEFL
jgi:hypothetical protein